MSNNPDPGSQNGKVCYIEIPASDITLSAEFYQKVFGWHIRSDNAGNTSFDDTTGQVSGMWVANRKPSTEPGLLISIMVDSVPGTLEQVVANGGKVIQEPEGTDEVVATFADPAGNVFCLYQAHY